MSSVADSRSIDLNNDIPEQVTGRDSVGVEPSSKRPRHSPPSFSPSRVELSAQSLKATKTPHTSVYTSEEDEYIQVNVKDQEPDLTVGRGLWPPRLVAHIMQVVSKTPYVQASAREQDHLETPPNTHTETEIIPQEQGRILTTIADCACSAGIEQGPCLALETLHNVSHVRSSPRPVQSQQFQGQTRVDRSSPSSRGETLAEKSAFPPPQDNLSLPLTPANLFRLEGSHSSSSVASAEASEASFQSQRGTDQRSQRSQSTDEMANTPMQVRFLLERNDHFINHLFPDDTDGARRCEAFKEAGKKIINGLRVSDWEPEKALVVQKLISTYKTEPEATFLFFVWHALLNESRHTYQRPYEEERTADMENWMETQWTKSNLRYKFNIDYAKDSIPPLIATNTYEKELLNNVPRVANPKPDIAFAVYKDAFTRTEREIFDQIGCSLTGNGSYHEFASLDAKSMNASIEEAENQSARSGSAMVSSRRKLNDLYAKCRKPSTTELSTTQPSSTQPPSTEPMSKIKTDTMAFTFAFATSQAKLFVNWDLDQDGSVQWHMHNLRNYDYDNLGDLTQLHHDIDNIMQWGVDKRKDKIQMQTARIIQNKVLPSASKPSRQKRKLEEAEA